MANQEWFPYDYECGKIMVIPEEPPLVRRSAGGAEVRDGGRSEIRPKYREEFTHCGMSMDFARPVLRRYLADGTD